MSTIQNFSGINIQTDTVAPQIGQDLQAAIRSLNKQYDLLSIGTFLASLAQHIEDMDNPHKVTLSELGDVNRSFYDLYLAFTSSSTPLTYDAFQTSVLSDSLTTLNFLETLILNVKHYNEHTGVNETSAPYDIDQSIIKQDILKTIPVYFTALTATDTTSPVYSIKTPPLTIDTGLKIPYFSGYIAANFNSSTDTPTTLTLQTDSVTLTDTNGGTYQYQKTMVFTFDPSTQTIALTLTAETQNTSQDTTTTLIANFVYYSSLALTSITPLSIKSDQLNILFSINATTLTLYTFTGGTFYKTVLGLADSLCDPVFNNITSSVLLYDATSGSPDPSLKSLAFWAGTLSDSEAFDIYSSWLMQ